MRFSRSSLYALYGMTLLAGAPPAAVLPLSKIRRRLRVAPSHLAKIFQALVRVGLLKSSRGVGGGFSLARPAERITALDIILAVYGPRPDLDCPIHSGARGEGCAVGRLIDEGRRRMKEVLGQATLADLAGRSRGGPTGNAPGRARL